MPNCKTYSKLMLLQSFEERFEYLRLKGRVGRETFGGHRYLNQSFYTSREWRQFRNDIIIRDLACDLAMPGYEIQGRVYLHHIIPVTIDQLIDGCDELLDPENVVCVSYETHSAIHYGGNNPHPDFVERTPFDTCPWKR